MQLNNSPVPNPFSEDHLAVIRNAMNDEDAYYVPHAQLGRLADIIGKARESGCLRFWCNIQWGSNALLPQFANYEGKRFKASMGFCRMYEKKTGKFFERDTAYSLRSSVESLVLNVDGFDVMRHIR